MPHKFDTYKKSTKRRAGWTVFIFLVLLSAGASFVLLDRVPKEEIVEFVPKNIVVQPEVEEEPEPTAISHSSRILFTGETFWGRKIAVTSAASELGTAYPFAKLDGFNKDDYNAWHTHLECPVTDENITFEMQANDLIFNCEPSYLQEYAKWFDIATLANNHTDNVNGEAGLLETRANLEAAGVDHYGHYENANLDQICEIIPVNFDTELSDGSAQTSTIPIAFCGYHNVFRLPTEAELDVISNYSEHFITVVSPQMGAEYVATADNLKTQTYRAMVDRGADLIAASHPHWVQNTEVYNGTLIMYSLGNFMFDQEWSPDVKKGVGLDATFTLQHTEDLTALIELGKDCEVFGDDCLELAQQQAIAKPAFIVEYDLVVSEFANSQTFPASAAVTQQMLERTNWDQTKEELENANN